MRKNDRVRYEGNAEYIRPINPALLHHGIVLGGDPRLQYSLPEAGVEGVVVATRAAGTRPANGRARPAYAVVCFADGNHYAVQKTALDVLPKGRRVRAELTCLVDGVTVGVTRQALRKVQLGQSEMWCDAFGWSVTLPDGRRFDESGSDPFLIHCGARAVTVMHAVLYNLAEGREDERHPADLREWLGRLRYDLVRAANRLNTVHENEQQTRSQ